MPRNENENEVFAIFFYDWRSIDGYFNFSIFFKIQEPTMQR